MNIYFFIAGVLCIILGLVHSFLGEQLIFRNKRKAGLLVPTITNTDLRERHLRIIWATWHLASLFGWCIAAILIKIAITYNAPDVVMIDFIIPSITVTNFLGALLVLVGTKGKHPGWIVLLIIAILLLIGTNA